MNSDSPINKQVVSQKGGNINPAWRGRLPPADSLHDFDHAGDRNATRALEGVFRKAGLPGVHQIVHELSAGSIDSSSLVGKASPGKCNATAAGKAVSFERRTTAALDDCALENAFTKAITWGEIINASSAKDLAMSLTDQICVIQNGSNPALSYGRALRDREGNVQRAAKFGIITRRAARNKVAHFILEFMFPGYTDQSVGVSYDAAGAKITKIFSNIGQVKAVITPQNISDSASTMLDPYKDFKQYGHKRTNFIFPQQNPETPGQTLWQYSPDSTYFLNKLKPPGRMTMENENFNTNNPNGFKIRIYAGNPQKPTIINYDKWSKNIPSGPSAPYLALALKAGSWTEAKTFIPNTSTIIPLGEWGEGG